MRLILRLVGIAAILGMTLYLLWRDERPPEDADLRNYRRVVKDEENGFRLLDLTQDDIVWPEDYDDVLGGSAKFDREKASEIARSNASLFEKVDLALGMRDFQVDVAQHVDDPAPHLIAWIHLRLALESRSRLRIEEGRPDDAYEDAMRLIRLGGRIQRGQGTLLECLVGFAIQGTGIQRLVHMGVHGQLPARVLRRGIEELRPEIARTALADAFKAEYVMLSNSFDLYVQGKVVVYAPGPRFLLKPNQTRRLLGEKIRAWIERDAVPARSRQPLDDSDTEYPSSFEIFVLRGAGRKAIDMYLGSCSSTQREADFAPVRLAATRALLAIAAYRAEKGALPDSLEALVPAYLESLPLDPITGNVFLYSASRMILYSTGADGFDSGGSTNKDGGEALADLDQPTLRLDPAAWKLDTPEDEEPSDDGGEE